MKIGIKSSEGSYEFLISYEFVILEGLLILDEAQTAVSTLQVVGKADIKFCMYLRY